MRRRLPPFFILPFLPMPVFILVSVFALVSCASGGSNSLVRSSGMLEDLGREYYLLADSYAELKKYDKALELYQKASRTGVKSERELSFKIARTAALAKDWNTALKEYGSLLEKDKDNLLLKKSIAWIYGQKGDLEKAETEYEALYTAHSYDKDVCTNYILVLHALKKNEQARVVFSSYAELYPDAPNIAELEKLFTVAKSENE